MISASKMEDEVENVEPNTSSSGRTRSMRNSGARQIAVNFMPSRQLQNNTMGLRRTKSEHLALLEETCDPDQTDSAEHQANIIVRGMEQHQQLMEDNPEAEELRREALRDLPQGLTMKRNVRAKLSASVSLRSKRRPISFAKRLKYRISFGLKRFREYLGNLAFSIELWYEAIRKVEGHFGSAVGSYFYFLRWLFLVNFTMTVFVVSFVVIPQVMHDTAGTDSTYTAVKSTHAVLDFISGKGVFEDTILFYGHYHSGHINRPLAYNMSFAYFFTMLLLYLTIFIVLCFRTAYSYRRNFIETAGGLGHVYASKVFCGWDFGIATQHAAALNARSIYNEFKELLGEQNRRKEHISFWTQTKEYLVNVLVTICVLLFIAGVEFGLYAVLSVRVEAMETLRTSEHWALIVSAIATTVVAVCPVIFNYVVILEFYRPRTALYVTLARTFLLDISTIIILLLFWSRSYDTQSEEPNSEFQCWETALGQETYRLVLFDAVLSLFFIPMIEFIRGFVYKMCSMGMAPEFNIAYNSLTLIYNQAILWLGMLFCPLLVVIVTIKFFLIFYVKRACVMYACHPARKIWRASQTQTVLYMLVNLSLFLTLFAVGTLFIRTSSQHCGPFRHYEYVYAVLTEGLLGLSTNTTLREVLTFVTRPGVIAFVLLFLTVGVYYMRAKSLAQRSMVRILRQMLVLEAKDKDFLLSAITKVSNGEWLYSPKLEEMLEPNNSHTWKYLNDDKVRKPSNAGFHFEPRPNTSVLDQSRPRSYVAGKDRNSHFKERPVSHNLDASQERKEDGDTDSSFSWQGSTSYLSDPQVLNVTVEGGKKKWL